MRTLQWFLTSKRALLAPYGLGTVDQALLGSLYARHFFLRLFGLAGKTVVVDEVHAYDVYTGRLVLELLPWLRALGCHVVLLSATLPARLRADLLKAWDPKAEGPEGLPDPARIGYPALWQSAEGRILCQAGEADGLTADRSQHATLEQGDPSPDAVAKRVARAVAEGAVVAVVCNTVDRAQEVFRAITAALKGALAARTLGKPDLSLLHGRFVQRDRQQIERHVVGYRDGESEWVPGRFGKGRPAGPAVLVGTQVIEQSLDLDVDLMLSDLAPIDLLLQRAGRLHRHDRDDRPEGYAAPHLVWLCPAWEDGELPDVEALSGGGAVYRRTVLWRTAELLARRAEQGWELPSDYRPLIEAIYGAEGLPAGLSSEAYQRWRSCEAKEDEAALKSSREAKRRTIPAPTRRLYELFMEDRARLADEDDETAAQAVRAATREGESVEVVVLHERTSGALSLDPAGAHAAPLALPDPKRGLPTEDVRALLGASVRLSQHVFVQHFRQQDTPEVAAWTAIAEKTPSLRHVHPVVLRGGVWRCGGRTLRWDDRLGLVFSSPSSP